ncbi:MAG: hypothetical protein WCJ25_03255 [Candidatus Moraniibacteriota bacterium]
MGQVKEVKGLNLGRYVEERFGNFPASARDEMIGIYRDVEERLRVHPGECFLLWKRKTCYRDKRNPNIGEDHDTWLIGRIEYPKDTPDSQEPVIGFVGNRYFFSSREGYCPIRGSERLLERRPEEAVGLLRSVFDATVLGLDSVKANIARLRKEFVIPNPMPKVKICIGDSEIAAWIDSDEDKSCGNLFKLLYDSGWMLSGESKRYREWLEEWEMIVDFDRLYHEAYPHIAAIAALVRVTDYNKCLPEFKRRLLNDLGIEKV